MTDLVKIKPSEELAVAQNALSSVKELAHTLQGYIWESDVKLNPKHDSVISALLEKIKSEAEDALRVSDSVSSK